MDIPGSFIITDIDEIIKMVLRGRLSELMAKLNPSIYWKYVRVENGKKLLYVQLKNAMYRTLQAALVFYQKILKCMDSQGFGLNLYDPCVVNNMVNGKHITIL